LFTEANKNRFINDLKLIDWNIVYNETDTNVAFNTFSNILQQLFEKKFKLVKQSRKKSKDKMWITPGLRLSSVHKNKLYKR